MQRLAENFRFVVYSPRDRNLLIEVDGMGDMESVSQRIFTGLDKL